MYICISNIPCLHKFIGRRNWSHWTVFTIFIISPASPYRRV